ncbi:hypothetical protein GJ496_001184 [Pomphorhynchus laevis]|nr:hypothetical protein GJ496_001184 [Pomphorhynchus laevis]
MDATEDDALETHECVLEMAECLQCDQLFKLRFSPFRINSKLNVSNCQVLAQKNRNYNCIIPLIVHKAINIDFPLHDSSDVNDNIAYYNQSEETESNRVTSLQRECSEFNQAIHSVIKKFDNYSKEERNQILDYLWHFVTKAVKIISTQLAE